MIPLQKFISYKSAVKIKNVVCFLKTLREITKKTCHQCFVTCTQVMSKTIWVKATAIDMYITLSLWSEGYKAKTKIDNHSCICVGTFKEGVTKTIKELFFKQLGRSGKSILVVISTPPVQCSSLKLFSTSIREGFN